jgi:hypothetical protein
VPLDPATVCELGALSASDAHAAKPREKDATTAPLALNQRGDVLDEALIGFNSRLSD